MLRGKMMLYHSDDARELVPLLLSYIQSTMDEELG